MILLNNIIITVHNCVWNMCYFLSNNISKISSRIHFLGDHDNPSYALLPPHQTSYGSPFRCRIIIYQMNNRWAYVCVYLCVFV